MPSARGRQGVMRPAGGQALYRFAHGVAYAPWANSPILTPTIIEDRHVLRTFRPPQVVFLECNRRQMMARIRHCAELTGMAAIHPLPSFGSYAFGRRPYAWIGPPAMPTGTQLPRRARCADSPSD